MDPAIRKAALTSGGGVALFAVVHSMLASLTVKRIARERWGERGFDGLYRFSFNVFSVISFGAFVLAMRRLPDRTLYRVRGPFAVIMALGQLAALGAVVAAARQVGFGRISGVTPAWQFLTGQGIEPAPPVQHPAPEGAGGALDWHGAYAVTSHPANYFALLTFMLSPIMSIRWAAIGLVTLVYMFVGSAHEDRRLLAAYGDRYREYRERVPQLFVPVRHTLSGVLPIDDDARTSLPADPSQVAS